MGTLVTGHVTKPGVDWVAIERGFRAGVSCRQLAKDHGSISHVAIAKRARTRGWLDGQTMETAEAINRLVVETAETLPVARKGGEAQRKAILSELADGSTLTMAAHCAGISPRTLQDWRAHDEAFRAACDSAQVVWAKKQMKGIEASGESGDWRARSWLMERHPATREEFGQQATRSNGPTIKIELAIPYPAGKEPTVIDVTPEASGPRTDTA